MKKQLRPRWTCFSISMQMAASAKKTRFAHTCEVCDLSTTHLNKHNLRTHVPWYVSPSTAWVNCHKSEGFGKDCARFHRGDRLISGDNLLRAWFLLMNGLFLFMSRELGLNSSTDLLTLAAAQHLPKISEEEYFYFREFDFRVGLEPLSIGDYMTLPPYTALHNWTSSCHDCTAGQIHCAKPFCFCKIC